MTTFHAGELAMQERAGMRERIAGAAEFIRPYMPQQHRDFFASLPMFYLAALDGTGQPWASMLVAQQGFISSPDETTLQIDGGLLAGDPLEGLLEQGAHVGGLGLEPTTRRRNRLNGEIVQRHGTSVQIAVRQSFGNCPKYIQSRQHTAQEREATAPQVLRSTALSAADRALIASADTYFIASAHMDHDAGFGRGVDISHRGGKPGFVLVEDGHTLLAPEFMGNFFFNTLGNLAKDARAGLLFIDFASGDLLHLAVDAEIIWDGPQVQAYGGAERLLRFHVREVLRNVAALPFHWSAPEPARQLERTGSWPAV